MRIPNRKKKIAAAAVLLLLLLAGGLVAWNIIADQRVTLYAARFPRDSETGIMEGAAPRTLGPEAGDKAVLFVHGFVGTPNHFNDLPDQVAGAGWYVRVMLLPGHGTSPREFEQTSADQLQQGVLDEVTALRKQYKTLVLVGHSMGGALSTLAASEVELEGLVLAAPYYRITCAWYYPLLPETFINTFSPLVRWIYRPTGMQPVNRPEARQEILAYSWIPSAGGRTAITVSDRARAPQVLEKITQPTLLIHSLRDTVTDPKASRAVFESLPAQDKRAVWLETSDHIIFWDYEREQIANEVLEFLKKIDTPRLQ
ncbi:MAG: alpha/beta fold hydrolase [Candidatus Hydrogenedentes bacterium]|nr:alpha/beta fold hydrolase [Candidatus Hydrogenedentota bacterium]